MIITNSHKVGRVNHPRPVGSRSAGQLAVGSVALGSGPRRPRSRRIFGPDEALPRVGPHLAAAPGPPQHLRLAGVGLTLCSLAFGPPLATETGQGAATW